MNITDILVEKARLMRERDLLQESRLLLEEAVSLDRSKVEAISQLGQVCGLLHDHRSAIRHLESADSLDSNLPEVIFTLGFEYGQTGRYEEALGQFDRLMLITPKLPALHRWRGAFLAELARPDEAYAAYREALRLKPDYEEAIVNLANLYLNHKHLDTAAAYFNQALSLNPGNASAHNDLGRIYRMQGRIDEAIACYRKALELEPDNRVASSNLLYGMCYHSGLSPMYVASEHVRIADTHYPEKHEVSKPARACSREEGAPIRVGYVSGDFYTHSVAFFIEPVLQCHDRSKFSVYCYSNKSIADETTLRIKKLDVRWRNIFGMSAGHVAEMIAEDGIDVLVDLSGHTAGHRLDVFCLKPAPIQLSWIGYPHSTGLPQVDYYMTDSQCDPPGMTDHLYREKLWRLPRVFSCYLPPMEFPAVSSPPFRENGFVTFGCFNNFAKVNSRMIALWAEILRQTPESFLRLKSAALGESSLREQVKHIFSTHGIEAERIILTGTTPTPLQHLEQYKNVDIALDTFPYHGTTTTCEALWMGVPVISLAGNTHVSRVGVSLLNSVGLEDLIASTPEKYVELTVRLASDRQRLSTLRERLRNVMARSPLMDGPGLTRDMENAYEKMRSERNRIEKLSKQEQRK